MQISNRGMTEASQIRGKKILSLERKLSKPNLTVFTTEPGHRWETQPVHVCESVCV